MADPGVVTALNYKAAAKKIFAWFFGMYFDGDMHDIDGQSVAFPDCEIKFENEQLTLPLTRPRIRIKVDGGEPTKLRLPKSESRMVTTDLNVTFWVIVSKDQSEPKAANRTRDNIQGLVESLLACFGFVLGTRGLRLHRISDDIVVDESPHYAMSTRMAMFYVTRTYEKSDPIED